MSGTEGAAHHRCPIWAQYFLISPLRRLMEPPRKLLGPHVRPGMTVLEPGCGFGYWSLPLARLVGEEGRVICLDVEPRAVARLVKRARRAGLEGRIDARECGPRDLGLEADRGQVDLVVAMHVLHELEDLPGFLEQAAAVLRPGGRMLVLEPRGHVNAEEFESEMEQARAAGFEVLERLTTVKGRLGAVLGL